MYYITGVGFAGFMHSGKDTSAEMLKKSIIRYMGANYDVESLSLAQPIKQFCMDYLGLTKHQCYDQPGKAEYNEFWGMTNREILQKIGTDAMRNGFHKDVWVKIAQLKLKRLIDNGVFYMVTDIRFPNECEMIRKNHGIVVYVRRDCVTPPVEELFTKKTHASEQKLDGCHIDYYLSNNGTLYQLEKEIEKLKMYIINNNRQINERDEA